MAQRTRKEVEVLKARWYGTKRACELHVAVLGVRPMVGDRATAGTPRLAQQIGRSPPRSTTVPFAPRRHADRRAHLVVLVGETKAKSRQGCDELVAPRRQRPQTALERGDGFLRERGKEDEGEGAGEVERMRRSSATGPRRRARDPRVLEEETRTLRMVTSAWML